MNCRILFVVIQFPGSLIADKESPLPIPPPAAGPHVEENSCQYTDISEYLGIQNKFVLGVIPGGEVVI